MSNVSELNASFFLGPHRYVQFSEYLGFVKTMDEFRGMKLVRKEGDKNLAVSLAVDFDRTKHLGDASIKRRKILRDRFVARDRTKEQEEQKRLQAEEEKRERERFEFNFSFFFCLNFQSGRNVICCLSSTNKNVNYQTANHIS